MHRFPLGHLPTAAVILLLGLSPVLAQDKPGQDTNDDNTRAVRILPDSSPAPAAEAPASKPPPDFAALNNGIRADNPAGLTLEMLPGTDVPVGAKIVFRISTKKPGYLVLIDVDSTGKLTQIYPNPLSTMRGNPGKSNLIKPGAAIMLPDGGSAFAGYEFVAEPPVGVAMVVALLSEQPVQIVDLPDVPATAIGQPDAFKQIYEAARSLKIVSDNGAAPRDVSWSVDAKYYAIR